MASGRSVDLVILTCSTGLTRFAFRSYYLYDIDSVNFALALRHFDPVAHQPHPPGYFLYVWLGKLVNLILSDANAALVAISILASCGAAAEIYTLTRCWFGRSSAQFAGAIFLFSPLAWFHGTVALTYIVEAFFAAWVGYLCWRVHSGAGGLILPLAALLGIAAGFRPSFLLFLGPLFLFSIRKAARRQVIAALGVLSLSLSAWFLPMIVSSGGAEAWLNSLLSLWRLVPGTHAAWNTSLYLPLARLVTIAAIYGLCFGCAAALAAVVRPDAADRSKARFTWVWVAPGLLFFTLVYLKFVNSGYLLVLCPPMFAWLGLRAAQFYAGLKCGVGYKALLLVMCGSVNTSVFLGAPIYCSHRAVRAIERELESILRTLPRLASPRSTLIVGFDSHFLGYRHAGYYLPSYLTVQYPEVLLGSGLRVFVMQHGHTRLESSLVLTPYDRFVLFPLPARGPENQLYLEKVQALFKPGQLLRHDHNGVNFFSGSITALPALFPSATAPRNPELPPRLPPARYPHIWSELAGSHLTP